MIAIACASLRNASELGARPLDRPPSIFDASVTSATSLHTAADFIPEAAADIAGNDADLALRHLHDLRELGAIAVRPLRHRVDRVAVLGLVVVGDRAARLHRRGGDPVDDKAALDDPVGFGERRIGRGAVPLRIDEADIVGPVFPDQRRARFERGDARSDRRERLVIDLYQLGRVLRLVQRLRRRQRRRNRRPSCTFVLGQRRKADLAGRPAASRPAAPPGVRRSFPTPMPPSPRRSAQQHAGRRFRRRGVDRANAGMGVRRRSTWPWGVYPQPAVVDIAVSCRGSAVGPRNAAPRLTQRRTRPSTCSRQFAPRLSASRRLGRTSIRLTDEGVEPHSDSPDKPGRRWRGARNRRRQGALRAALYRALRCSRCLCSGFAAGAPAEVEQAVFALALRRWAA